MALVRILDWSKTAPTLPPRERTGGINSADTPRGAQIRRDGVFYAIRYCDCCGEIKSIPLDRIKSTGGINSAVQLNCEECQEEIDAEIRAKHADDDEHEHDPWPEDYDDYEDEDF